jgi:hypothetical protein
VVTHMRPAERRVWRRMHVEEKTSKDEILVIGQHFFGFTDAQDRSH